MASESGSINVRAMVDDQLSNALAGISKELKSTLQIISALNKNTTYTSVAVKGLNAALQEAHGSTTAYGQATSRLAQNQIVLANYFKTTQAAAKALEQQIRNNSSANSGAANSNNALMASSKQLLTQLKAQQAIQKGVMSYAYQNDLKKQAQALGSLAMMTSYAGTRMSMGLTLPLAGFFRFAFSNYRRLEVETVRTTKLLSDSYGKRTTEAVRALGKELDRISMKYGVSRELVQGLAGDYAELGISYTSTLAGLTDLTAAIEKLGNVDIGQSQQFLKSVYQNILRVDRDRGRLIKTEEDYARVISEVRGQLAMFNVIENKTSLSLQDIAKGFPEMVAATTSFGLSMADATALLVPMVSAGFQLGASANSIKVSLQRLVDPTKENAQMLSDLQSNLEGFNVSADIGIDSIQKLADGFNNLKKTKGEQGTLEFFGRLFGVRQGPRMQVAIQNLAQFQDQLDTLGTTERFLANKFQEFIKSRTTGLGPEYRNFQIKKFEDLSKAVELGSSNDKKVADAFSKGRSDFAKFLAKQARQGEDLIGGVQTEAGRAMFIGAAGGGPGSEAAQKFAEEIDRSLKTAEVRFQQARESIKALGREAAPIFADILNILVPVLRTIVRFVQNMPDSVKKSIMIGAIFLATLGPAFKLIGALKQIQSGFLQLRSGFVGFKNFLSPVKKLSLEMLQASDVFFRFKNAVTQTGESYFITATTKQLKMLTQYADAQAAGQIKKQERLAKKLKLKEAVDYSGISVETKNILENGVNLKFQDGQWREAGILIGQTFLDILRDAGFDIKEATQKAKDDIKKQKEEAAAQARAAKDAAKKEKDDIAKNAKRTGKKKDEGPEEGGGVTPPTEPKPPKGGGGRGRKRQQKVEEEVAKTEEAIVDAGAKSAEETVKKSTRSGRKGRKATVLQAFDISPLSVMSALKPESPKGVIDNLVEEFKQRFKLGAIYKTPKGIGDTSETVSIQQQGFDTKAIQVELNERKKIVEQSASRIRGLRIKEKQAIAEKNQQLIKEIQESIKVEEQYYATKKAEANALQKFYTDLMSRSTLRGRQRIGAVKQPTGTLQQKEQAIPLPQGSDLIPKFSILEKQPGLELPNINERFINLSSTIGQMVSNAANVNMTMSVNEVIEKLQLIKPQGAKGYLFTKEKFLELAELLNIKLPAVLNEMTAFSINVQEETLSQLINALRTKVIPSGTFRKAFEEPGMEIPLVLEFEEAINKTLLQKGALKTIKSKGFQGISQTLKTALSKSIMGGISSITSFAPSLKGGNIKAVDYTKVNFDDFLKLLSQKGELSKGKLKHLLESRNLMKHVLSENVPGDMGADGDGGPSEYIRPSLGEVRGLYSGRIPESLTGDVAVQRMLRAVKRRDVSRNYQDLLKRGQERLGKGLKNPVTGALIAPTALDLLTPAQYEKFDAARRAKITLAKERAKELRKIEQRAAQVESEDSDSKRSGQESGLLRVGKALMPESAKEFKSGVDEIIEKAKVKIENRLKELKEEYTKAQATRMSVPVREGAARSARSAVLEGYRNAKANLEKRRSGLREDYENQLNEINNQIGNYTEQIEKIQSQIQTIEDESPRTKAGNLPKATVDKTKPLKDKLKKLESLLKEQQNLGKKIARNIDANSLTQEQFVAELAALEKAKTEALAKIDALQSGKATARTRKPSGGAPSGAMSFTPLMEDMMPGARMGGRRLPQMGERTTGFIDKGEIIGSVNSVYEELRLALKIPKDVMDQVIVELAKKHNVITNVGKTSRIEITADLSKLIEKLQNTIDLTGMTVQDIVAAFVKERGQFGKLGKNISAKVKAPIAQTKEEMKALQDQIVSNLMNQLYTTKTVTNEFMSFTDRPLRKFAEELNKILRESGKKTIDTKAKVAERKQQIIMALGDLGISIQEVVHVAAAEVASTAAIVESATVETKVVTSDEKQKVKVAAENLAEAAQENIAQAATEVNKAAEIISPKANRRSLLSRLPFGRKDRSAGRSPSGGGLTGQIGMMASMSTMGMGTFGMFGGNILQNVIGAIGRIPIVGKPAVLILTTITGAIVLLKKTSKMWGEGNKEILSNFKEAWSNIGKAFKELLIPVEDFFGVLFGGTSKVESGTQKASNALVKLSNFVLSASRKINSFVKSTLAPALRTYLSFVMVVYQKIKPVIADLFGLMAAVANKFNNTAKKNMENVKNIVKQSGDSAGAGTFRMVDQAIKKIETIPEAMSKLGSSLGKLLSALGILIQGIIGNIVFDILRMITKLMVDAIEQVMILIVNLIRWAIKLILAFITDILIGGLFKVLSLAFKAFFKTFENIPFIGKYVKKIVNSVADGIDNTGKKIGNGLYNAIADPMDRGLDAVNANIGALSMGTDLLFNKMKKANTKTFGKQAMDMLRSAIPVGAGRGLIKSVTKMLKEAFKNPETANAAGEALQDTLKKIGDVKKQVTLEFNQSALDAVSGALGSAIGQIKDEIVSQLNIQKDTALKVFDDQIAAIEELANAEERLTATEEYETNRRKMIRENDLRKENYRKDRALAIYEGRIDDARTLDLQQIKDTEDFNQELIDLDKSRQKDLQAINRSNAIAVIKAQREAAAKQFDQAIKDFEKYAEKLLANGTFTQEEWNTQTKSLLDQAGITSTSILTTFQSMFSSLPGLIQSGMDPITSGAGFFSTGLAQLIATAQTSFGLATGVPNPGSILGLVGSMLNGFGTSITTAFEAGGPILTAYATGLNGITTLVDTTLRGTGPTSLGEIFKQSIIDAANKMIVEFDHQKKTTAEAAAALIAEVVKPFKAINDAIENIKLEKLKEALDGISASIGGGNKSGGETPAPQTYYFKRFKNPKGKWTSITKEAYDKYIIDPKYITKWDLTTNTTGNLPKAFKGGMMRYINGGPTFGPMYQGIPAILHGGEFVLRKTAVDKYGLDMLNQMNQGIYSPSIPKIRIPMSNYAKISGASGGYGSIKSEETHNYNFYVDNFIGETEWFNSMMKEYNMKVVPANQKQAGLESRVIKTYNGLNRGM